MRLNTGNTNCDPIVDVSDPHQTWVKQNYATNLALNVSCHWSIWYSKDISQFKLLQFKFIVRKSSNYVNY